MFPIFQIYLFYLWGEGLSIKSLIKKGDFYHHFQPIYNINDCSILGYEGLFRSNHHSNPEVTFLEAKKEKQLFALDTQSIQKAIRTYQRAGFTKADGSLFLNIFPSTVLHKSFQLFIEEFLNGVHMENQEIIFEINERENISDIKSLKYNMDELKEKGFKFALDDVGKGYTSVELIVELEPEIIKIDRYFTKNLDTSEEKQMILSFLLHYCEKFNLQLILEGIENEIELAAAKSLGLLFVQGYKLGKPALLTEKVPILFNIANNKRN